jgi:pyruvate/2-oxoglutarate dehydrogenase complex dihydrolipoamide acyltransferase (E2) component
LVLLCFEIIIGESIEARPMMYFTLMYEHWLIDGREVA